MATDKTLVCRDCSKQFVFTAGEQDFYAQKGLQNEPRRCPECRSVRKRNSSGLDAGAPRQLFAAICASCGTTTQVPFQPKQDRPVYCSDCFSKQRA